MNRLAFTLAEVLITIGIIGIIAAMTIPSLIQKKTNRELKAALQKNYSVLQSALNKANYENGLVINPSNVSGTRFHELLMTQFDYVKDCKLGSCIVRNTETNESGDILDFVIKEYKTFNKKQTVQTNYFDDGQFIIKDGSLIMIEHQTTHNAPIYFTIDVNGMDKKPNAWGHDLFTFQIINNGKLLPMGAEGTEYSNDIYCSYTSTNVINGIGCTYKALTDKNYWDNLP